MSARRSANGRTKTRWYATDLVAPPSAEQERTISIAQFNIEGQRPLVGAKAVKTYY